jgi:hypothetical protein
VKILCTPSDENLCSIRYQIGRLPNKGNFALVKFHGAMHTIKYNFLLRRQFLFMVSICLESEYSNILFIDLTFARGSFPFKKLTYSLGLNKKMHEVYLNMRSNASILLLVTYFTTPEASIKPDRSFSKDLYGLLRQLWCRNHNAANSNIV